MKLLPIYRIEKKIFTEPFLNLFKVFFQEMTLTFLANNRIILFLTFFLKIIIIFLPLFARIETIPNHLTSFIIRMEHVFCITLSIITAFYYCKFQYKKFADFLYGFKLDI